MIPKYPMVYLIWQKQGSILRMLTWYKGKEEWLDVAPLRVTKLFKQQSKELEGIQS